MASEKHQRHKQPGTDQIPAASTTIRSERHKLINSVWKWKESITETVYKKGDKTDCSNYRRVSLLSTK
jgi:hypothetical protein